MSTLRAVLGGRRRPARGPGRAAGRRSACRSRRRATTRSRSCRGGPAKVVAVDLGAARVRRAARPGRLRRAGTPRVARTARLAGERWAGRPVRARCRPRLRTRAPSSGTRGRHRYGRDRLRREVRGVLRPVPTPRAAVGPQPKPGRPPARRRVARGTPVLRRHVGRLAVWLLFKAFFSALPVMGRLGRDPRSSATSTGRSPTASCCGPATRCASSAPRRTRTCNGS